MALSRVIIYNATRTLNFAQGEMLMSRRRGLDRVQVFQAPLVARCSRLVARRCSLPPRSALVIRHAIAATHFDVLIITLGLSLMLGRPPESPGPTTSFPFPFLLLQPGRW